MVKRNLIIFIIFMTGISLFSQEPDTLKSGIHQVQNEYYSVNKPAVIPFDVKGSAFPSDLVFNPDRDITKKVLGWHPYWVSATAYLSYDYNALSHLAYFSYEVDTATGGYTSIHDWNSTPIIDYAHQRGTRVLLTVTNFGTARNTELLTDTLKQKYLINRLIALLKARNGDGVNFDLESVSVTQRANLVSFINRAVTMIKAQLPEAEISMATPAVDWSNAWDFKALAQLCDYLIVMGYDYYWKGSATAGPVSPLEGETYNVTRTVNTYLTAEVPPERLLLGVPWYGYDWPVVNSTRKATATGTATARLYTAAMQIAEANPENNIFDFTTKVPWVAYTSSSMWRQLWYDNIESLGLKYSLVKSKKLGGIGIWALSYEGGSTDMWGNIINSFAIFDTTKSSILKIYPNPASESCRVEFYLNTSANVNLTIYDSQGKKRIVLFDGDLDAGFHSEFFESSGYGAGIYLCVMKTGNYVTTRKIVVIKR